MKKTPIGKGALYLTASNMTFLVTGYVIFLSLGRLLGPENYGIYGLMKSFISIINILLTVGIMQAVSRYTAQNEKLAEVIKRKALKFQIVFSLSFLLLYLALSGFIAHLLNDSSLIFYIKLVSILIPIEALACVFSGYLNGNHLFSKQSLIQFIYAFVRITLVIGLVLLGFSVAGALLGYILAAFVYLLICLYFVRFKKSVGNFPLKKIIYFAMPITGFTLLMTLLMQIDIFFLKSLLPSAIANINVGYYVSGALISRFPFLLTVNLCMVLFPVISKTTHKLDIEKTRMYIKEFLRYALLFLSLLVALISSTAKEIILFIYSSKFLPAAVPLKILVFGLSFFALFYLLVTVINASGKPRITLMISLIMLLIDILLCYYLIPIHGLVGAAIATSSAMLLGLIVAGTYVLIKFKVLMSIKSFLRIIASGIVIFILSTYIHASGIFLIIKCIILACFYFVFLIMLKEIKKKDFIKIKETLSLRE